MAPVPSQSHGSHLRNHDTVLVTVYRCRMAQNGPLSTGGLLEPPSPDWGHLSSSLPPRIRVQQRQDLLECDGTQERRPERRSLLEVDMAAEYFIVKGAYQDCALLHCISQRSLEKHTVCDTYFLGFCVLLNKQNNVAAAPGNVKHSTSFAPAGVQSGRNCSNKHDLCLSWISDAFYQLAIVGEDYFDCMEFSGPPYRRTIWNKCLIRQKSLLGRRPVSVRLKG